MLPAQEAPSVAAKPLPRRDATPRRGRPCRKCGWLGTACVVCGKPLEGRQEDYCSGRCRTRACRDRKVAAQRPAERPA